LTVAGIYPHKDRMEQLLDEIRTYAERANLSPQAVLRRAIGASWGQWDDWLTGKSSPTMRNVDKLRGWMVQNPIAQTDKDVA
jgi:hypothetical protein